MCECMRQSSLLLPLHYQTIDLLRSIISVLTKLCNFVKRKLNVTSLELGLGTEFRSEKIPRNRLGTVSVILRKKVLIPRYSEFRGRANSEARNGTERSGIPRKNKVLRNRLNIEKNYY
jgi:hypothetical protein